MKRFVALFCLVILGLSAASAARAQGFGETPLFPPAKFGENNPQLKALLTLQYQMQVLKRMIERERSVNAMIESAMAIGAVDPFIPKPDETLCRDVPANIVCAQAYKDIYPGYSVEKAKPPAPPMPAPSQMAANGSIPALSGGALDPLPPPSNLTMPVDESTPLYWADITCLQERCSAIITTDPRDPRARYRVAQGEKLADGAVVSTISANGVTIKTKKKSIDLEPAPKA